MVKKIIVCNWKQNGSNQLVDAMLLALGGVSLPQTNDLVICPPSLYLQGLAGALPGWVKLGLQNPSAYNNGAYTGEVSASMAAEMGVAYALVAHSERRTIFGEQSNDLIGQKLLRCIECGIKPILCIGETLEQKNTNQTHQMLKFQLLALQNLNLKDIIIAYEPVWSIGTGNTPSAEEIELNNTFIAQTVKQINPQMSYKILYGGSVNGANYKQILSISNVDGLLIGSASLVVENVIQFIS